MLEKIRDEKEISDYHTGFNRPEVKECVKKAVWTGVSIGLKKPISFKRANFLKQYLKERQPRQQMEELKSILQELHKVLPKNFKVEDILMAIGDDRAKKRDEYAAHWEIRYAAR